MKNIILFSLLFLFGCKSAVNPPGNPLKKIQDTPDEYPLETIQLPEGFEIDLYAADIDNARSMCLAPDGTLFVGTRSAGFVYALKDTDGDYKVDQQYTLLEDGNMPNGVAFKDGDLYVAEVSRILKYSDILSKLDNPGTPEVIYDEYPTEKHHGWKYIAFGPDDRLYVPVGAPCNICKSEDEVFASITSINADGTDMKVEQHGVRNTVGFDWHPDTNELWFTDNGRDRMGDDIPGCELNRASKKGMHFGYPYCHQGDVIDDELGEGKSCNEYTAPAQVLDAHVAPLGIEFYTGNMFPSMYKNQAFFAEHGSWNRSRKSGYRVMMVTLDDKYNATSYEPFLSGWLDSDDDDDVWGRPVDIELMPDGSMLVSDDFANAIYRVTYTGS